MTAMATQQTPLTGQGTILGTLLYMSPEQLEGRESDHRADIWAFGAILYELVSAKKAFEGTSHASIIAAILGRDPNPVSALNPTFRHPVDHVVKRA